jgi:hypothetical protein
LATKPADILLIDSLVVTMNALGDLIPQGAVAIRNRDIVAVGPTEAILAECEDIGYYVLGVER